MTLISHLDCRRAIFAGSLIGTRETAAVVAAEIGFPIDKIEIDASLREIDYGLWEGKSTDEIDFMGGGAELAAWENCGKWPSAAGWGASRAEHVRAISSLIDGIRQRSDHPVLIVSSNGIFRLLSQFIHPQAKGMKMATGHLSLLSIGETRIGIVGWNVPPRDFAALVASAQPRDSEKD